MKSPSFSAFFLQASTLRYAFHNHQPLHWTGVEFSSLTPYASANNNTTIRLRLLLHATATEDPHLTPRYHYPTFIALFRAHRASKRNKQTQQYFASQMQTQSDNMPSEYRHMSTGSLNIPPPTAVNGNGGGPQQNGAGGMGRFEGPRSPPGRQSKWDRKGDYVKVSFADSSRHISRSVQVLSAGRLPGWTSLPFQP